jgi:hypothetical protein
MYQQIVKNGVMQADSLAAFTQLGGDIKGFQIASVSLRDEEARIAQLQKAAAAQGFTGVHAIELFTEFVKKNQDKVSKETRDLINANRAQQAATMTMERGLSEFNAAVKIHNAASETFANAVKMFGDAVGVKVPGGTPTFGGVPVESGVRLQPTVEAAADKVFQVNEHLKDLGVKVKEQEKKLEDAKTNVEKDKAEAELKKLKSEVSDATRAKNAAELGKQALENRNRLANANQRLKSGAGSIPLNSDVTPIGPAPKSSATPSSSPLLPNSGATPSGAPTTANKPATPSGAPTTANKPATPSSNPLLPNSGAMPSGAPTTVNKPAASTTKILDPIGGASSAPAAIGTPVSAKPAVAVISAGSGFTTVQTVDGTNQRREGARNWRNNNPGNIEYGQFSQRMGAIGSDGRFAVFPTLEMGTKAKEELLFGAQSNYKNLSIANAINRYAPPSENNTQAYIAAVTSALGVSDNTILAQLSSSDRSKFLETISRVEGFNEGTVLQARDGGMFQGPMSGYPAVLHGQEAVIPLKNGAVPVMMPALDELVSSNRAVDAQVQVLRNEMGSMMRELVNAIQTMKETGSQERMIQLLESMSRSQQTTAAASQRMAQLASN